MANSCACVICRAITCTGCEYALLCSGNYSTNRQLLRDLNISDGVLKEVRPNAGLIRCSSHLLPFTCDQAILCGVPLRGMDLTEILSIGIWMHLDIEQQSVISSYIIDNELTNKRQLKTLRTWCFSKNVKSSVADELERRAYSILVLPLPKHLITLHNHPMQLVDLTPQKGTLKFAHFRFNFTSSEAFVMGIPLMGLKLTSVFKTEDRVLLLHGDVMNGRLRKAYVGHTTPPRSPGILTALQKWAVCHNLALPICQELERRAELLLNTNLDGEASSNCKDKQQSSNSGGGSSLSEAEEEARLAKSVHLPQPIHSSHSVYSSQLEPQPIHPQPLNSQLMHLDQGTLAQLSKLGGWVHVGNRKRCLRFQANRFCFFGVPTRGMDLCRLLREGMAVQLERQGSWVRAAWVGPSPHLTAFSQLRRIQVWCCRFNVHPDILTQLERRASAIIHERAQKDVNGRHTEGVPSPIWSSSYFPVNQQQTVDSPPLSSHSSSSTMPTTKTSQSSNQELPPSYSSYSPPSVHMESLSESKEEKTCGKSKAKKTRWPVDQWIVRTVRQSQQAKKEEKEVKKEIRPHSPCLLDSALAALPSCLAHFIENYNLVQESGLAHELASIFTNAWSQQYSLWRYNIDPKGNCGCVHNPFHHLPTTDAVRTASWVATTPASNKSP